MPEQEDISIDFKKPKSTVFLGFFVFKQGFSSIRISHF